MTSGVDETRVASLVDVLQQNRSGDYNSSAGGHNISMENTVSDPLISLQVPAIMFSAGVFGNILAIIVLTMSSKDHKQTVFYRLVGALACTDLFGTCAISPVTLAVYANKLQWVGGDTLCNYESFMFIFAGYSTIFIIGTMAIDRFIALTRPFFYDEHITYKKAKYFIIGLWGFAAFMGLLPIMGLGENVRQFPGSWCFFSFTSSKIKNQIFSFAYGAIGLFIIVLTTASNLVVMSTLLKMRRKARASMGGNTKRHDSELQMVILLLGIIVIFSTCWCPFLIRILVNQSHQSQVDVRADLHALRLASFNQILDPWIYILFRKELFVKSFVFVRKLFSTRSVCRACKDEVVECEGRMERSETIGKSRDDSVMIQDAGEYLQDMTANDVEEDGKTRAGRSVQTPYHSRQSASRTCSRDHEEMMPLNDVHKLHLKHSACLFCFSNHPKCVILSSKSMDCLHLLSDDKANCSESKTDDSSNCHGFRNTRKVDTRRESIHQSLLDLSMRTDECLSAGNSDNMVASGLE